jgi:glucosamine 6-phosphate synthetase-like amidotransferase/phosphosugar isomerase protein
MCGIAGFSISDKDHRVIRTRLLSEALLRQIQSRGRDATGAVWSENVEGNTELYFVKDDVDADTFIKQDIAMIPKYTRTALLHTRYATQGSPEYNENNHPIVVPTVIGVHNGHISNDDEIIEELGVERIGEVDSEAIFHLIAEVGKDLKKLNKLQGRAAVGWYEIDDPKTMHLARLSGSPLFIGKTKGDSLVFASTKELLEKACREAHVGLVQVTEIPEWTYLKVVKGEIVERRSLRKVEQSRLIPSMPMRDRDYVNPHMFNVSARKQTTSLRDRMDTAYGFRR